HESNLLVADMLKHEYMKLTINLATKIITYLRKSTQAIQYIRARINNSTFRFSLPTFTRWNSFFVSLQQVQNKEQYLKDMAYEMESRLDKAIISILKDNIFWHHLRIIVRILETYSLIPIILESRQATYADTVYFWAKMQIMVNTIDDVNFKQYVSTRIQHRWDRMYHPLFLVCWSLHPQYVLSNAIRPELATVIKKEASLLFESLFPNKDIIRFRKQLIDWKNKAYPFDFEGNWDDYLIKDPVYFWNNFQSEVPELALFASRIMSIPPTSADSERFWSVISNIHTPRRNKLTNDNAFKLTCIRWNMTQKEDCTSKNNNIKNVEQIVQQDIVQQDTIMTDSNEANIQPNISIDVLSIDNEIRIFENNEGESSEHVEEQAENQDIMKTIENINMFSTNDQITYDEAIGEITYNEAISEQNKSLENWLLFENLNNVL
ncbi:14867_t:CDS:1, partial [Cetraspora pellucida]